MIRQVAGLLLRRMRFDPARGLQYAALAALLPLSVQKARTRGMPKSQSHTNMIIWIGEWERSPTQALANEHQSYEVEARGGEQASTPSVNARDSNLTKDWLKRPPAKIPSYMEAEWQAFDSEFLKHRSPFETIIRGHLYVQSALINLVRTALDKPDAINLARIDFSSLVQWAVALGLIERQAGPGFHKLNSFRNRFAHNLYAGYSLQDAIDLFNALGRRHRAMVGDNQQRPFREEQTFHLTLSCIKSLVFSTKADQEAWAHLLDETRS